MRSFYFLIFFILMAFGSVAQGDSIPGSGPNASPSAEDGGHSTAAWDAFNRGEQKKRANKLDMAITEYDKAMEINPDFYQVALARGGAKFLKYDFQGALGDYDMAVQIIEKLNQAHSTRSEIKNVLGDAPGAVAEMDAANKLKPFLAEAYYRRGSVKKFLSNKEGSCADFNKAMEMGFPKAETSMRQYCGYVSPESAGGAKTGGAGAKSKAPAQNTPATPADSTQSVAPAEK